VGIQVKMNWLEKLIGISPDQGDGTTEAFLIVLVLLGAVVFAVTRAARHRRTN